MKVLSLYCGAGGLDEGLKQSGIKTTLAIDINKDACETMKLNHDCEVINGKVSDYKESLSGFDMVIGGPPCPNFSRANPNRTFNLCEVNLFWEIVEKNKPDYYLMENVQDMRTFLHRKHYLIDTADYGVPQNRIRCIFTNLSLPPPTHSENGDVDIYQNQKKKWIGVKDVLKLKENEKYTVFMKFTGRNAKLLTRSVSKPIQTITTFNALRFVEYEIKSKKYSNEKIDTKQGRLLTLEELVKLQGFPDDYKFTGTKKSKQIQIGNAVPPPLSHAFFKQIENPITVLMDCENK